MRFREGEVIRIISSETSNIGSLIPIPMTMDIEGDWNPDTLTLTLDPENEDSIDYSTGTITYHIAIYRDLMGDIGIMYLNDAMLTDIMDTLGIHPREVVTTDRVEEIQLPILPVMYPHELHNGRIAHPNMVEMGIIIVDDDVYPMRRMKSHIDKAPLSIPARVRNAIEEGIYGIEGITMWMDDLDEWLIRLYDFGYTYAPFAMHMSQPVMYRLIQNRNIIYKLLVQLSPNVTITSTMRDTKVGANSIVATGGSDEAYHILAHDSPDYMAWLFTPSGWYHYGYQTDNVWLFKQDRVDIRPYPHLTKVLLSMVNIMPISGEGKDSMNYNEYFMEYYSGGGAPMVSYDLPIHIRDVLATINQDRLRVVLAGGFVVTQGDYDFFILDGDIDTAREMMDLLDIDRVTYHSNVITSEDKEYQFILATDMHSILDVLYSFDMSHAMIAHDGRQFHITPEFMTFTSAGLSLMVLPVTRTSRLRKIMSKGYRVVYTHAVYDVKSEDYIEAEIEPSRVTTVDDALRQVVPRRLGYLYGVYVQQVMGRMPISSAIAYGQDLQYMNISQFKLYMDDNGISYGYRPLGPDTLYYVEHDHVDSLLLAREVLDTTPLSE